MSSQRFIRIPVHLVDNRGRPIPPFLHSYYAMPRPHRAVACGCWPLSDRAEAPEQRMAFLVGAHVAADLNAMLANGVIGRDRPVALAGSTALTAAWDRALAEASVPATVLAEDQIERALLAGLGAIFAAVW